MNSIKRQCRAMTADGSRCKAAALTGSDFCFFHDPDRAEERREAQILGGRQGKARTLAEDEADLPIESSQDVVRLLSDTINQVRKGQLDPRVANAVGYLSNVLLKAVEQGDLEDRLAALEAVVDSRRKNADPFMADVL